MTPSEIKWLKAGADNEGEWLVFPHAGTNWKWEVVYMFVKGNGRTRFFDPGPKFGGIELRQVGPEHTSVYTATCWAFAHQWVDPTFEMTDPATGEKWNASGRATVEVWTNSSPQIVADVGAIKVDPSAWKLSGPGAGMQPGRYEPCECEYCVSIGRVAA